MLYDTEFDSLELIYCRWLEFTVSGIFLDGYQREASAKESSAAESLRACEVHAVGTNLPACTVLAVGSLSVKYFYSSEIIGIQHLRSRHFEIGLSYIVVLFASDMKVYL